MKNNEDEKVKVLKDEEHILLDHDYDGIRELNHPLPKWWLIIFYGTIVFAIFYYVGITFMGAQTINQELKEDVAAIKKVQADVEAKEGKFNLVAYNKYWAENPKAAKVAKKTYKRKCKSCHGPKGEGGVGPNLADKYWLHGNGSLETVYNTINKGVVDKGMAAWGPVLGKDRMYAVLKYVMDFQGTNPEGAKEPQGTDFSKQNI